ncbi:tripartite tricarboxylate transporter TctB family protein [Roseicyclus sp. F158]|uniref:Tripartite tricarboxylate transporter TctB family protein n=1 Tax=Tropicimonas omnivorans TaxID=3075590 RepID=A0ABU3DE93_9RHOB|nr:tripartite tricarboxylate transporter TctB family protein [Roseicyclus sp. F158]MDT0682029.1 tripartite tricarboxylate transporter TctB family protein [Roseicyclus sp. F158]
MTWLMNRASAFLMLALAAITILWIIPAQTPSGFDGYVQPGTMPRIMAWLVGIGAVLALFERDGRDTPDLALLARSALFLGALALSLALALVIGFKWAAPVLSLAVMVLAYERRWLWLTAGAVGVPLAIWLLFEVLLGRPLV